MTEELKTLKDIEFESTYKDVNIAFSEALRQEAIKWVKEYKNKTLKLNYKDREVKYSGMEMLCLKIWIMHFFNLTEEDLK
jgi:hypothetical protein